MSDDEWELLTAITVAGNAQDHPLLYQLLKNEQLFTSHPQCLEAALWAIQLTQEHIAEHHSALCHFVAAVPFAKLNYQARFRLSLLKQLLLDTEPLP